MLVKITGLLILFELSNYLHFGQPIDYGFAFVGVNFVQNLQVALLWRQCHRVDVVEVSLEDYTGLLKTVD